jgi:hypothetical protein
MASSSNDRKQHLDASFNAFVAQTLEKWHVPGMAIAIIDGDFFTAVPKLDTKGVRIIVADKVSQGRG